MAIAPDSPYLTDASGQRGVADEIKIPADEAAVIELMRDASAQGIPVTISGAGTGITAGRVPEGGWLMSLEKLSGIDIHTGYAVCGACATLAEIQAAAGKTKQFYAPDPTEYTASLGGTIATNASGSRSFLYGSTRRHVRALRVVLASGELLTLRRGEKPPFDLPAVPLPASTKCTAGYYLRPGMDYLDLFIGSEGTLGIVTSAEIALLPAPAELFTGVVFFAEDARALDAVDAWRAVGGLRMLEYVDAPSLDLMRPVFGDIPKSARAALIIEQESEREAAAGTNIEDAWIERLDRSGAMAEDSWFALSAADRERFRRFRHALPEAVNEIVQRRGFTKLSTDLAVPIARSREMLAFYRQELDREIPGKYVIFGHIGDAHVHVNILPSSQDEFARAKALTAGFAAFAVSLGGTVSAEHGLGKRKREFLALQYTADRIEAMKSVKRRLDPQWLLGRGTLFAPSG